MAKRWQYPIKADVIFIGVPPEAITLDKWFILSPDPLRKKPHVAAFTHYLSFVSPIAVPEEVTLDKWFTQCSEPIKKNVIPYYYPTTVELFIIPEAVTLDKWFTQFPDIIQKPYRFYYYPYKTDVIFIKEEAVTLDKWFIRLSEPVKLIENHNYITTGFYDFSSLIFPEQILLDKWFVKTSEPIRPKFQPYYYPCIDYRELSIPFVPSVFKLFFDNYMRIEDE